MNMRRPSSLSVTYYDPEAEPVPEPEPTPDLPKPRGRPPGSKNKVPRQSASTKRTIPWFNMWRAVFWAVAAAVSLVALYRGMEGWLGQSAAYVALAVSVPPVAFLLDRDWKKMHT